ncbi:MAPEG family protein [Alteromonas sp. McT4-15]|uniref:MAPEG family protein n=1 Tax=Alteromonas sp. McT4-15 TaxID=2881256 RepID=UPI001CF8762A|nr:MAPEG family protein [Alteromonas sp. McT4-15]MCB4436673.1 MAPEG family protein [Alteromonas sp. McT4-15]
MDSILLPVYAHLTWCTLLYGCLTIARAPAIWGLGSRPDGSNPFAHIQPKISANLSNQFEWPVFFHILCVILYCSNTPISAIILSLAWLFVFGRVVHSIVQICGTSIRLRGIAFTINFVAVLAMWTVSFPVLF